VQAEIAIITPCYNENKTVIAFLQNLEQVVQDLDFVFHIVVVDDHSTDETPKLLRDHYPKAGNIRFHAISLRFNVGHQMAIYQGMLFASALPCAHFVIMDSDGEDNPRAIPEMLATRDREIIHVARGKRNESLLFLLLYKVYKLAFKLITGKQMNFGNYSMISRNVLDAAVFNSFIHYPAFLSKQKVSIHKIKWNREKRIDGRSKMNLNALFYHAFHSFVEYAESLLILFFRAFIILMILFLAAAGNVLYQKLIADTAILGWTSVIAVGLLNLAVISIGIFILGVLLLNMSGLRNTSRKMPIYNLIDREASGERSIG